MVLICGIALLIIATLRLSCMDACAHSSIVVRFGLAKNVCQDLTSISSLVFRFVRIVAMTLFGAPTLSFGMFIGMICVSLVLLFFLFLVSMMSGTLTLPTLSKKINYFSSNSNGTSLGNYS